MTGEPLTTLLWAGRTLPEPVDRFMPRATFVSLPALLWLALWFGINSGPWVLHESHSGLMGWLHWMRTVAPLGLLPLAWLFAQSARPRGIALAPVRCWMLYALIGLAACSISPQPADAAYWAVCYLATLAVVGLYAQRPEPLAQFQRLNQLSWLIATAFLLVLVYVSREVLFAGETGYSAYGQMETVADMAMSRSSGIARFAAVPTMAGFAFLWRGRGWQRCMGGLAAGAGASLIYFMQSRGAILGIFGAMLFVAFVAGQRSRIVAFLLSLTLALVVLSNPGHIVNRVEEHLRRGQDDGELCSMTGRTRAWAAAWEVAMCSPLFGWGPQADRILVQEHVHNTYLYALLQGGVIGLAAFVAGLGWAWLIYFRALRNTAAATLGQECFFLQIGGILAFFTIRSIPEVCGALYSVDLMVMLPALAYLGVLEHRVHAHSMNSPAD